MMRLHLCLTTPPKREAAPQSTGHFADRHREANAYFQVIDSRTAPDAGLQRTVPIHMVSEQVRLAVCYTPLGSAT